MIKQRKRTRKKILYKMMMTIFSHSMIPPVNRSTMLTNSRNSSRLFSPNSSKTFRIVPQCLKTTQYSS
jgi:hypothetical protein